MARNLTEDEVKWIEERRKQQEAQSKRDEFEGGMSGEELDALDKRRQEMAAAEQQAAAARQRERVNAMHDAARGWRRGQADREEAEREHWNEVHRQNHGGFSKAEMQAFGPDGSIAQRKNMMRAIELRAAREHEAGMQGKEMETRLKEAEQKRLGMKEQGSDAATIRANADKDMLGLTLGDKEKQRAHELAMLGQTQTFQGTQNDAERKNKLDIAGVQGKSAVEAAKAQAEARAADIAAKNEIEREKIRMKKDVEAMKVDGKLTEEGKKRLSKTYNGYVAIGYSPAVIRQKLLDDGWSAEDIAIAQGRQ